MASNDAGPAPAFVTNLKDLNAENIPWMCALDPNGTAEGMDEPAVDSHIFGGAHTWANLCSGGIEALEVDGIA